MKTKIDFFKTFFAPIILIVAFASCSSDDNITNPNNPNPNPTGNSGVAHTYNITVDGQSYSGTVDNVSDGEGENGAVQASSLAINEDGITHVTFTLKNNDITAQGLFDFPIGESTNLPFSGDAQIYFTFPTDSGLNYSSDSGTTNLTIREQVFVLGIPIFSELTIEFNGTFTYRDNNDDLQSTTASGTIKINLPPGY